MSAFNQTTITRRKRRIAAEAGEGLFSPPLARENGRKNEQMRSLANTLGKMDTTPGPSAGAEILAFKPTAAIAPEPICPSITKPTESATVSTLAVPADCLPAASSIVLHRYSTELTAVTTEHLDSPSTIATSSLSSDFVVASDTDYPDLLNLRNCCRLCLEEPQPMQMLDMNLIYDQDAKLTYYDCYAICTKADLRLCPKTEPYTLCKRCGVELQWAYDFHKKVAQANQQIKEIFKEVSEIEVEVINAEYLQEPDPEHEDHDSDEPLTSESVKDLVPRQRFLGQFSCLYCKKMFKNHSRMIKHQLIHLANRPKFVCPKSKCQRVYLTKQALKVHVVTKHNQTGSSCQVCGKLFAIAKGLEIHMRYHNGDFPFACDQCDCKYAQSSHLKIHQQVKHSGARFICKFVNCDKSFTSSASLRNHECIHTMMPFQCRYCDQTFPARHKLRLHIERKHNKRLNAEELESMRRCQIARSKLVLTKMVKQPHYSNLEESNSIN